MCRATMINTMTVARIPTTAVCWAMLYRFSGDRKMPSDNRLKTSAITTSTPAMSTMRQSTEACLSDSRDGFMLCLKFEWLDAGTRVPTRIWQPGRGVGAGAARTAGLGARAPVC